MLESRRLLASDVSGIITTDTVWSTDINLAGDVRIRGGAELTIQPGVIVTTSSPIYELYISDDSSGAALFASGVNFIAPVILQESAIGSVSGSTFAQRLLISGTETSLLSFSGNTINTNPSVHAEFIPRLASNVFGVELSVLAFGVIDKDAADDLGTIWPLIPNVKDYRLENDVFVRDGVFLEVEDGVTLASTSPLNDLFVSDDNSAAALNANDVSFQIDQVFLDETATGSVTASEISGVFRISGTEISTFVFNGNTINTVPIVHAEYVPRLVSNTFASATVIEVFGTVDATTSWPNITNVQQYRMVDDVIVAASSTLTLEPGVAISSATPLHDLFVSSDNSGAALIADGVTFLADQIFVDETATGSVTGSVVSSVFLISGALASTFVFSANVVNATPSVHAEYVPRLANNTFAAASVIDVSGVIENDTIWPKITNVTQYRLIGDVLVRSGSGLSVASGTTVTSVSGIPSLVISDDNSGASLSATGVAFLLDDVVLDETAKGIVSMSTIGGEFVIFGTETSTFQFRHNTVNFTPRVDAEYVPKLATNHFVGTTTMNVFGTIDSDLVWPQLDGLRTYQLSSDVRVTGVGSLIIDRDLELSSTNAQYELFVGDPASVARLELTGVTIGANIVVFESSEIKGRFNTFTSVGSLRVNSGATVDVHYNDFSGTLPDGVMAEGDPTATIDMTQNWWGTVFSSEIETKILHQPDDAARPLVLFDPYLLQPLRVPDYVPIQLDVTSPPPLIAGGTIDVTYQLANLSLTGGGENQSAVLFYLNSNPSQNGSVLLDFAAVGPLGVNASTGTQSATLTLPGPDDPIWGPGLPGTYVLSMLVDASNTVMEYIETNNTISTTLDVSSQVLTVAEPGGQTAVAEGGLQDSVSIALTSVPTFAVTVIATPEGQLDLGAGAGQPVELTFLPGDATAFQSVPVIAVDDDVIEGPHLSTISYRLSSSDPNFNVTSPAQTTVTINDNDSVKVAELRINDTDSQRSTIQQIDVVFNTVVDLSPGALELVNQSTNQSLAVAFGTPQNVDGRTIVPVTYDALQLTDGNYQIRIASDFVSAGGILLDGDDDGIAGENYVDSFFRLLGDSDGDRDVDGQDYGRFAMTYQKSEGQVGFNRAFDFDRDGDVDGHDLGRFEMRFLKSLPR